MALGVDTQTDTYTHTNVRTKAISKTRCTRRTGPYVPGLKINFEFRKGIGIAIKSKETSS